MNTIFINTENGKTNEPHRLRLYFTDKLDLRSRKTIALANLSIYYTWENVKSKFNNNKFKRSGPTWSETFDLTDGLYKIQDIQDYILKMINKHEKVETDENSAIFIYPDGVKNRLNFRIKTGYKLDQVDYLQNSKLLYEFVPDEKFGQLISVKSPVFIQCKTSDSIFDYIGIWFTDQNNKSLQIEDKVNVTLIIQNNRL